MGFTLSQCDAPAFCSIWDDGNHIDGRVTMGVFLSYARCVFFFLSFAPAKILPTPTELSYSRPPPPSHKASHERLASSFQKDMKAQLSLVKTGRKKSCSTRGSLLNAMDSCMENPPLSQTDRRLALQPLSSFLRDSLSK